jgi:hypothetical protein
MQPFKMTGMLAIWQHEHDGTITCMFITWHAHTKSVIFEVSTAVKIHIIILWDWKTTVSLKMEAPGSSNVLVPTY